MNKYAAVDLGAESERVIIGDVSQIEVVHRFANRPVRSITMKRLIDIMDSVLGWETSLWEIMKLGERRTNLAKAFNIREGFRRKDDILPKRMFEPIVKEHTEDAVIDEKEFNEAIDLMYEMMNWDEEGIPRKAKLHELDIGWVINKIFQT